MKLFFPEELERYACEHSTKPPELLLELEAETKEKMKMAQMLTGPVEGALLGLLVRLSGARRAVDVGTFTGYSALMIAEALPPEGEVITCENSEANAGFAMRYIKRSPHAGKITLKLGPALDTLKSLEDGSVDFIFIDADKEGCLAYYEEGLRALAPGGLIVVDNVFWSGKVLNPEDDDSRAVAAFNTRVAGDERVQCVMLSVRDGVTLIRKR